ncbi:MAG: ABC transporter permease [Proteobacteria bacterium]|nr:ABC transporter permease [Pseudomonadota bacterium]
MSAARPHASADTLAHPGTGASGRFSTAWLRELDWLARSRWDLALVTLAPLVTLVVLGLMFVQSTARLLPIAVVDADHSPLSRQLVRNLRASAQVAVVAEPVQQSEAWALARRTDVWAVVIIPEGLQRDALSGAQASVLLYRNAAFYSVGALASRGVSDAVAALNAQLRPQLMRAHNVPAVRLEAPRIQATILFNPQLSYEWFLEALLQPGILHVLLSCAVVVALGREMQQGSLHQWLHAGGGAAPALAAKLAPYVLIFTAWQLAGTAWLCGWRGWGVHGSLALLAAGQLALYACYAAIAAFVALLVRDTYTALSAVALYGGPALTFSDATLPVIGAPLFTQVWSHVLPFSAYVKLQMEQMFMGSPASASLPWLALMSGVALAMFLLASLLLRRAARHEPAPAPA